MKTYRITSPIYIKCRKWRRQRRNFTRSLGTKKIHWRGLIKRKELAELVADGLIGSVAILCLHNVLAVVVIHISFVPFLISPMSYYPESYHSASHLSYVWSVPYLTYSAAFFFIFSHILCLKIWTVFEFSNYIWTSSHISESIMLHEN